MDCSYDQALAVGSQERKRGPAKLMVTVWVEGTLVTAPVDSGCSQTLIWANLVEFPEPEERPVLL